jgi:hypothetical protein
MADVTLTAEKRYYSVIISRELHVYASSADEATQMARVGEPYAVVKVTIEIITPPTDEAIPV